MQQLKKIKKKIQDGKKKGATSLPPPAALALILRVVAALEKRNREEEGLQSLTQLLRAAPQGACLPSSIGVNIIDQRYTSLN